MPIDKTNAGSLRRMHRSGIFARFTYIQSV